MSVKVRRDAEHKEDAREPLENILRNLESAQSHVLEAFEAALALAESVKTGLGGVDAIAALSRLPTIQSLIVLTGGLTNTIGLQRDIAKETIESHRRNDEISQQISAIAKGHTIVGNA